MLFSIKHFLKSTFIFSKDLSIILSQIFIKYTRGFVKSKNSPQKKDRVHLLISISNFLSGGTQQSIKNLALAIDQEKFKITICNCFNQKDKIDSSEAIQNEIIEKGIQVFNLNIDDFKSKKGRNTFNQFIKGKDIDIIYALLDPFDRWSCMYAKTQGIKVSVIKKGATYLLDTSAKSKIANRLIDYFFVDHVISVSSAVTNYLIQYEKIPLHKIKKILNPVNATYFHKKDIENNQIIKELDIKEGDFIVGNTSRFVKRKGLEYFLEAASKIIKSLPEAKFILIGWGEEKDLLNKKIHSLALEEHVQLINNRRDIKEFLSIMDVFLFTSLWGEGLSNSLLEAMSMEVPVVASNIGSNNEAITDGIDGFLPTPKKWQSETVELNSSDLSRTVLELAHNKDLRNKIGKKARLKVISAFNTPQITRQFEDFFLEALQPHETENLKICC